MPPFDFYLFGSYWVAIIAGIFLVIQAAIAIKGSREVTASADLRALVTTLQKENVRRFGEITALQAKHDALQSRHEELQEKHGILENKLETEVELRKQAERDNNHCRGALERERVINEGHTMTIDVEKRKNAELTTQLTAAHDEIDRLHNMMRVTDPETSARRATDP